MFGVADVDDAESFHIIDRGKTGQGFDIAPVAASAVEMEQPGGFCPGCVHEILEKAHYRTPFMHLV
jgi:hypothetical protein